MSDFQPMNPEKSVEVFNAYIRNSGNVKKTAEETNTNRHTVTKWKNEFQWEKHLKAASFPFVDSIVSGEHAIFPVSVGKQQLDKLRKLAMKEDSTPLRWLESRIDVILEL